MNTALHTYRRNTLGDADTMLALLEHVPLDTKDKHEVRAFIMLSEEDKNATLNRPS